MEVTPFHILLGLMQPLLLICITHLVGAGNVDVSTFSCWFKVGAPGTDRCIFSAGPDANNRTQLILTDTDKILYQNVLSGTRSAIISTSVFRDLAGWYNIVVAVDTGQGTASDRVHVYIKW